MIDEGDIQNVQGWGYSRTGLRTTALVDEIVTISLSLKTEAVFFTDTCNFQEVQNKNKLTAGRVTHITLNQ